VEGVTGVGIGSVVLIAVVDDVMMENVPSMQLRLGYSA
jgi:hypothetical protein